MHYVHEAWTLYRNHFWLILKLILPAVLISYFVTSVLAQKMAEFSRHMPSHIGDPIPPFLLVQVGSFRTAGFLTSWIGYCFSYAAICVAVSKVETGIFPDAEDCFSAVRERLVAFLKISALLFFVLVPISVVLVALGTFIQAQYLSRFIPLPSWIAYQAGAFCFFLSCLIVSRFSLAHPSVLFEDTTTISSLFKSDELTEGKWTQLSLLIFEGTLFPFYMAQALFWILQRAGVSVPLPAWSYTAVYYLSVTLSILTEPIMLIGFAIMYLETREVSHPPPVAVNSWKI